MHKGENKDDDDDDDNNNNNNNYLTNTWHVCVRTVVCRHC